MTTTAAYTVTRRTASTPETAAMTILRGSGVSGPTRDIRVLQVINSYGTGRGGAEVLALGLHADLRTSGVRSELLGLEAPSDADIPNATSLGFANPYDPRVIFRLAAAIGRAARRADVIHAHLFPTSAYISLLVRTGLIRKPCLFTEHNTWNRRRDRTLGRAADSRIYRKFDRIVAISEGTRSELVSTYPILAGKVEVIVNGILPRFERPVERTPTPVVEILSIGRLVRQKNYDTALRALARLGDRRIKYTILGAGEEEDALRAFSRKLGLENRVFFEGFVADIGPYVGRADIFLMPSRWEGFGLAAVEAMNASLPLVVSNVEGLREVTGGDESCALHVRPDDVDAMAGALAKLIDDPDARRKKGRSGFERSKLFRRDAMVARYADLYRRLARAS